MTTFQELGVREDILRAITELGYEKPMPIQEKVIPHLLNEDSDVIGLAQTGTGKTAAFGLPTLQRIDTSNRATQAIILDPTRELCLQTCNDLNDYAKHIDGLTILPVYGGTSIETQIRAIKRGVQIVVATPGRLIDLLKRGVLKLDNVRTVILDEADEMLNMGFVDDINSSALPTTCHASMASSFVAPEPWRKKWQATSSKMAMMPMPCMATCRRHSAMP